MNRSAVASIAIACMVVAAIVGFTDPTRGGQAAAFGIGMVAAIVLCIGIMSEASWGGHSTRSDTTQHVNVYVDGTPQHQQGQHQPKMHPAYYAPRALPQIIVMPMPGYPPMSGHGQMHPGYLPAPQSQGYLAPPTQYPVVEHHQHQPAQFLGAIDVVAEPVRYAQHPQQIRQGQVPRLESPEAGLIRRMARKIVG